MFLKIISLHTKHDIQIRKAILGHRDAQEFLFKYYSPKMLGVCRRYVNDVHHAEDLMLQGFLKVFKYLDRYNKQGSFEGWIRKIMVNTCITYLQKKNKIIFSIETEHQTDEVTHNLENTAVQDIQKLIDALPDGYKIVFNLYAIEGYKHSEIAAQLKISESTSKSQLFKARKFLQNSYKLMNKIRHEYK